MSIKSYFNKSSDIQKEDCFEPPSPQSDCAAGSHIENMPLPSKRFNPGSNYTFPKKLIGKKLRSCQSKWFDDYQWLHYDENLDRVFCFVCMKQNNLGNLRDAKNKDDCFTKIGFYNWKKTEKLQNHQCSKCHETALTFEITIPKCGDAKEMNDKAELDRRVKERKYLLKVMECVQFLGRQGLPIRGHDFAEENLRQLMLLRCKDYPDILKRFSEIDSSKSKIGAPTEKKYLHQDYQNEMLTLMTQQILRKLLEEVKLSKFFAIMCDEYTDISNLEQLSFCIRWVEGDLVVHEDFLGYYEIPNIKSETIVNAIKDILIRYQLSLNNCRGQTYDGASNMVGRKSGVGTQILSIQPKALVTHCHGHSLSLTVKDVTSQCKILRDTMGTAGEIIVLVKFSPKREKMLGSIVDNLEVEDDDEEGGDLSKIDSLSKLSITRWTVRADCFRRLIDNYTPLYRLWLACLSEQLNSDVKSRIIGCKAQMHKFDFFFGIQLAYKLYALTDNLSKTLQLEKMSAVSGKRNADLTRKTLQGMRNDNAFDLFYDTTIKKAKNHDFVQPPTLTRKRKKPNYSILNYVDGMESDCSSYSPSSPRDHYRGIYFEAIDTMISALDERFSQPCFEAFAIMETLLLKAICGEDIDDELAWVGSNYANDVNVVSLETELLVFKHIFKNEVAHHFDDILKTLESVPTETRKLFPNVIVIVNLLLINPATSATPERSFSAARRIKTWLRSSMTQLRFNDLTLMNIHKHFVDDLNLIDVGNDFVKKSEQRFNYFGKFIDSDLQH